MIADNSPEIEMLMEQSFRRRCKKLFGPNVKLDRKTKLCFNVKLGPKLQVYSGLPQEV